MFRTITGLLLPLPPLEIHWESARTNVINDITAGNTKKQGQS